MIWMDRRRKMRPWQLNIWQRLLPRPLRKDVSPQHAYSSLISVIDFPIHDQATRAAWFLVRFEHWFINLLFLSFLFSLRFPFFLLLFSLSSSLYRSHFFSCLCGARYGLRSVIMSTYIPGVLYDKEVKKKISARFMLFKRWYFSVYMWCYIYAVCVV